MLFLRCNYLGIRNIISLRNTIYRCNPLIDPAVCRRHSAHIVAFVFAHKRKRNPVESVLRIGAIHENRIVLHTINNGINNLVAHLVDIESETVVTGDNGLVEVVADACHQTLVGIAEIHIDGLVLAVAFVVEVEPDLGVVDFQAI